MREAEKLDWTGLKGKRVIENEEELLRKMTRK
jgi:hypothetical protein